MFGLPRGWPRVSLVSAELRAELDAEVPIYVADRVGISRHFSGHVPGVYSSTGVARYRGAFAFTRSRIVATFPTAHDAALRAIDSGWDTTGGPARTTITERGLRIDIDLRRVDREFSGDMSFTYTHDIPADVLHQLPATELSFPVDPLFIYRAAGVEPRG